MDWLGTFEQWTVKCALYVSTMLDSF